MGRAQRYKVALGVCTAGFSNLHHRNDAEVCWLAIHKMQGPSSNTEEHKLTQRMYTNHMIQSKEQGQEEPTPMSHLPQSVPGKFNVNED